MASSLLIKMMILAFFLMVITSMSSPPPPPSDGFSVELIPPHSPHSPFYHSFLVNPVVSPYKQEMVVKIGIGTIDGDVPYKSYLLTLDTGSDLIWIQCEQCKVQDTNRRCYPQQEEPFPDSKSRTYQPQPSSHPLCKPRLSDENGHCIYTVKYKTGSINSTGVLSNETFRFPSTSSPSGTEALKGIVFGFGYKNFDPSAENRKAGDVYQIAGTFGMSPGPRSFLSQYKPKKFSFCMVPPYVKNPPPTYLRFGSEVKPLRSPQTVDLLMTKATKKHFVLQLEDLGVNGKRLRIGGRNLGDQLVVDSGSTASFMLNHAHEKLVSKLDSILITATGEFEKDVLRFKGRICYKRMGKAKGFTVNIPIINYYFKGGAHLDLPPQNVFEKRLVKPTEWFCLNIFPDQQVNLLGAYQQADFKFIFDTKTNKLQFGPENCAQNS